MITNKMKLVQLKMRKTRFWPKMKFEPIFFSGSLAVFQSERVASAGGRKGGLGGIPPALQILGEICSNFFERTPQRKKLLHNFNAAGTFKFTYLIVTTLIADQLSDTVRLYMPSHNFLVTEVNLKNHNGWLPQDAWNWINKYV